MADPPENRRNVLWMRAEQIQRWAESETNGESSEAKSENDTKVKFRDGCIFLAACSSGELEDVENLLRRGADINTANIDGLTALHQACIDENFDVIKFLVEHDADLEACDNEGWTALHATASCGFIDIAKYLVDKGASVSMVTNDGELPIDLVDDDYEMIDFLSEEMEKQGVDADAARCAEENQMLDDATKWHDNLDREAANQLHPKTGATALHVAAAKGYMKVMGVLLQLGVNVDAKDTDGWTPLHAAAHWGQEDAARLLVENFCNMDLKNFAGQRAIDIAPKELKQYLLELKQKQAILRENREGEIKTAPRHVPPLRRRSSVTRMSIDQKQNVVLKDVEEERATIDAAGSESSSGESTDDSETEKQNEINRQSSISKKETIPEDKEKEKNLVEPKEITADINQPKPPLKLKDKEENLTSVTPSITDLAKQCIKDAKKDVESEKENMVEEKNKDDAYQRLSKLSKKNSNEVFDLEKISAQQPGGKPEDKTGLKKSSTSGGDDDEVFKMPSTTTSISTTTTINKPKPPVNRTMSAPILRTPSSVLKQVTSFESKSRNHSDVVREGPASWRAGLRKTGSTSTVSDVSSALGNNEHLSRSASSPRLADDESRRRPASSSCLDAQDVRNRFNEFCSRYNSVLNSTKTRSSLEGSSSLPVTTPTTSVITTTSLSTTQPTTTQVKPRQSSYIPQSRRKLQEEESNDSTTPSLMRTSSVTSPSTTSSNNSPHRKSYELPKRDEERETERKAKAKRARETRRSTQGVTREELAKAAQTIGGGSDGADMTSLSADDRSDKENKPLDTNSMLGRRRAWDEKKEEENSVQRLDATGFSDVSTGYIRGIRSSTTSVPSKTTSSSTASTTTSSISSPTTTSSSTPDYRSAYKSKYSQPESDERLGKKDDKEEFKSSAIRSRRKRESRRPTGKISVDDLQGVNEDEKDSAEEKPAKEEERTSRYGSSRYSDPTGGSHYDRSSYSSRTERPVSYSRSASSGPSVSTEKEIDYKKLYEEEKRENEGLRRNLKKCENELKDVKHDLEKLKEKNDNARLQEPTIDKRKYRALERKVSELEEELKMMENLKQDNQRMKEENAALIRVISKLSLPQPRS